MHFHALVFCFFVFLQLKHFFFFKLLFFMEATKSTCLRSGENIVMVIKYWKSHHEVAPAGERDAHIVLKATTAQATAVSSGCFPPNKNILGKTNEYEQPRCLVSIFEFVNAETRSVNFPADLDLQNGRTIIKSWILHHLLSPLIGFISVLICSAYSALWGSSKDISVSAWEKFRSHFDWSFLSSH